MNVRDTIVTLRRRLLPEYGQGETQAIIRIIFQYLKGWDAAHIFMNEDKEVSPEVAASIERIMARLERHEPIQYITGIAPFYGIEFHVDRRVLIPRPETERLVDMVVDADGSRDDLRVLDICTGSGCIAIALARNLRFPKVEALDISADALAVARENARSLNVDVTFEQADIFKWKPEESAYDVMVSNPPYIALSERDAMEANVLDYEPEMALFPGDDPLIFYSRIAEVAAIGLKPSGQVYLEINPKFAEATAGVLRHAGLTDVELSRDIHGDYRYAKAVKR